MAQKLKSVETQSTAARVEELLGTAKSELSDEATKHMVKRIKSKLQERVAAAKVLANIDREVDMLKLELAQELESLNATE